MADEWTDLGETQLEDIRRLMEDVQKCGGVEAILGLHDLYTEDQMSVPEHWRRFFGGPGAGWNEKSLFRYFLPLVGFRGLKAKDDEAFRFFADDSQEKSGRES